MYYTSSFDLSELYYTFCEVRCDNDEACVAFRFENGVCYLKDSCSVLEYTGGTHIHIKRTGTEESQAIGVKYKMFWVDYLYIIWMC